MKGYTYNMQYKKEEVRKAILKSAENEFINKGYQKSSVRKIAKGANVLPGNIYNYFDGKDAIFSEILKPVLTRIEKGKEFIKENEFDRNKGEHPDLSEHQQIILHIVSFIEENRNLLKLLLFKSGGSTLESYPDQLIEWYSEKWYQSISRKEIADLDSFIVHNIVSFWYSTIREILMHDISGPRLRQTAVEMMTFIYQGYQGLLEWKKRKE